VKDNGFPSGREKIEKLSSTVNASSRAKKDKQLVTSGVRGLRASKPDSE
jgi:hypothetical protein